MSGAGPRGGNPGAAAGLLAVGVFALLRFVVWDPPAAGLDLESSWHAVLHEARARGWSFGVDVVFTHGPYGFVKVASLHPATYAASVALQSALALWMVAALWTLLAPTLPGPLATAVASALLVELLVTPREGFYFALVLLPILFAFPDGLAPEGARRRALLHTALAAAALAALAKFSFALGLAGVAAVLTADALLFRRRPPWPLLTAGGACLVLWLAADQPLAALGPWIATSWELSVGFAPAMGLPGPWLEIASYAGVALLLLVAQALRLRTVPGPGSWLGALGLAGVLALVGKAAFVRHDWHASIAWATALPVAILLGLRARAAGGRRATRLAALAALLAAPGFATAWLSDARIDSAYRNPVSSLPRRAAALGRALSGQLDLEGRFERAQRELARETPLPRVSGTADVLTYHQGLLLASGLEYAPRPVFQSYSAYTPGLARRNAEYFAGPRAPQHVFLHLAALDDRYPSLDDSAALPALLAGYAVTRLGPDMLWLRRSREPGTARLEPLGGTDAELGRWLPVPEVGPEEAIWVELELRPTLLGRFVSLALRPPRLVLETRDARGTLARHRLLAGVARAGFLLSPRLTATADFADLAAGHLPPPERRVAALRVGPAAAAHAWSPRFALRFARLRWESESR